MAVAERCRLKINLQKLLTGEKLNTFFHPQKRLKLHNQMTQSSRMKKLKLKHFELNYYWLDDDNITLLNGWERYLVEVKYEAAA